MTATRHAFIWIFGILAAMSIGGLAAGEGGVVTGLLAFMFLGLCFIAAGPSARQACRTLGEGTRDENTLTRYGAGRETGSPSCLGERRYGLCYRWAQHHYSRCSHGERRARRIAQEGRGRLERMA
jgi:hypothetical protein